MGASLFVHHWSPHDADQPWGADEVDDVLSDLADELTEGARLSHISFDLRDADTVNPGPVNTGYLDEQTADRPSELIQSALEHSPTGR